MRGSLETIVGAMFAGKTSELLKRILWANHQNKKIVVIKPSIDDRYSESKIITHNDLSHDCFSMKNWDDVKKEYTFDKNKIDMVFLDEIQFLDTNDTLQNIELILNEGIDVVCAGLDQDSRGKPWETSSLLLGLSDKILKRANEKVSLSKMTFSHQMVRIIFLEQLYRSLTIIKNEPYHNN